jgi:signal transduction histidine kinase
VSVETRSLEAELQAMRSQLQRAQGELAAEREARSRAEEQASSKDDFIAMVSHELRAPLGAILGWAHLLRRRGGEEEFEQGLEIIEQSVHAQAKLIDDLLMMARMKSGRLRIDLELLDLRAAVDAAVESARPAAASKHIRLKKVIELSTGPVRGDAMRLQQVFGNLLLNAVKFTPDGGDVEISLKPERGWAVVRVADTGIGIAPEFLPHVFDRYRQHAAARTHGGLGLGLAIARQIVELHDGEVVAESEGEGCGAAFTVRLPLADRSRS